MVNQQRFRQTVRADRLLIMFLMGSMFIVLPTFWFGALGWAGIQVGHAITGAMKTGSADAKGAGAAGGKMLENFFSKALTKK